MKQRPATQGTARSAKGGLWAELAAERAAAGDQTWKTALLAEWVGQSGQTHCTPPSARGARPGLGDARVRSRDLPSRPGTERAATWHHSELLDWLETRRKQGLYDHNGVVQLPGLYFAGVQSVKHKLKRMGSLESHPGRVATAGINDPSRHREHALDGIFHIATTTSSCADAVCAEEPEDGFDLSGPRPASSTDPARDFVSQRARQQTFAAPSELPGSVVPSAVQRDMLVVRVPRTQVTAAPSSYCLSDTKVICPSDVPATGAGRSGDSNWQNESQGPAAQPSSRRPASPENTRPRIVMTDARAKNVDNVPSKPLPLSSSARPQACTNLDEFLAGPTKVGLWHITADEPNHQSRRESHEVHKSGSLEQLSDVHRAANLRNEQMRPGSAIWSRVSPGWEKVEGSAQLSMSEALSSENIVKVRAEVKRMQEVLQAPPQEVNVESQQFDSVETMKQAPSVLEPSAPEPELSKKQSAVQDNFARKDGYQLNDSRALTAPAPAPHAGSKDDVEECSKTKPWMRNDDLQSQQGSHIFQKYASRGKVLLQFSTLQRQVIFIDDRKPVGMDLLQCSTPALPPKKIAASAALRERQREQDEREREQLALQEIQNQFVKDRNDGGDQLRRMRALGNDALPLTSLRQDLEGIEFAVCPTCDEAMDNGEHKHRFDVADLLSRQEAWEEEGCFGNPPSVTCSHNHTHTAHEILTRTASSERIRNETGQDKGPELNAVRSRPEHRKSNGEILSPWNSADEISFEAPDDDDVLISPGSSSTQRPHLGTQSKDAFVKREQDGKNDAHLDGVDVSISPGGTRKPNRMDGEDVIISPGGTPRPRLPISIEDQGASQLSMEDVTHLLDGIEHAECITDTCQASFNVSDLLEKHKDWVRTGSVGQSPEVTCDACGRTHSAWDVLQRACSAVSTSQQVAMPNDAVKLAVQSASDELLLQKLKQMEDDSVTLKEAEEVYPFDPNAEVTEHFGRKTRLASVGVIIEFMTNEILQRCPLTNPPPSVLLNTPEKHDWIKKWIRAEGPTATLKFILQTSHGTPQAKSNQQKEERHQQESNQQRPARTSGAEPEVEQGTHTVHRAQSVQQNGNTDQKGLEIDVKEWQCKKCSSWNSKGDLQCKDCAETNGSQRITGVLRGEKKAASKDRQKVNLKQALASTVSRGAKPKNTKTVASLKSVHEEQVASGHAKTEQQAEPTKAVDTAPGEARRNEEEEAAAAKKKTEHDAEQEGQTKLVFMNPDSKTAEKGVGAQAKWGNARSKLKGAVGSLHWSRRDKKPSEKAEGENQIVFRQISFMRVNPMGVRGVTNLGNCKDVVVL